VLGRTDVKPSGVLDSATQRAIEDAELEFGLLPDGMPDKKLLRLLQARRPVEDRFVEKPQGWIEVRVQELLIKLGYFEGPATEVATGASGEAIRRAEGDLALPIDGVPDAKLLRLLEAKHNS
jgi:peptidoglycan hydrolase-like protein with peptidoglycan-binding domain